MSTWNLLLDSIYHERQEPDSRLCAQHALNTLLQGNYFQAHDLSVFGQELDGLEQGYDDDNHGNTSTNMDDTGFFSVQVLERALQVWDLNLVRWRNEAMKPFHSHPHTQLAFILNMSEHWYTLRRFGDVSLDPSPEANIGNSYWFNLNSMLPAPAFVGKTYLDLTLVEAERKGYSVFAVVQNDPHTIKLPHCVADEVAALIPEDDAGPLPSTNRNRSSGMEGGDFTAVEDADDDIQAAIRASLGYEDPGPSIPPPRPTVPMEASSSSRPVSIPFRRTTGPAVPPPVRAHEFNILDPEFDEDEDGGPPVIPGTIPPPIPPPHTRPSAPVDPVEESRLRNQALMQHVLRQQEAAIRETYEEEAARIDAQPRRRTRQEEEEDEDLRRAIEESGRPAKEEGHDDNDDDDDVVIPSTSTPRHGEMEEPPVIPPRPEELDRQQAWHQANRVYDDDDEQLQSVLRESLRDLPAGFRVPSPPPRPISQPSPHTGTTTTPGPSALNPNVNSNLPATTTNPPSLNRSQSEMSSDAESTDMDTESSVTETESEAESVDREEMRRRRLARFGG